MKRLGDIMAYARLTRPLNLLIIGFLQWALHAWVIIPLLTPYHIAPATSEGAFWALFFSLIFVAAGGYVINAYFDTRIDTINKPDRVIVGVSVPKRAAMIFYIVLTIIGTCLGFFSAFQGRSSVLAILLFVLVGLLWFYSSSYKRQFMIGNIIVAFVVASGLLAIGILEVSSLSLRYGDLIGLTPIPSKIYAWTGGFALVAFLITWIREIVKDMEDEQGDRELECRTMPVKWGIKRTKIFVYSLMAAVLILLYYFVTLIHFPQDTITLHYYFIAIVAPFVFTFYQLLKASDSKGFHKAATTLKLVMLAGILYSIVFYFLQATTYQFPFFGLMILPAM